MTLQELKEYIDANITTNGKGEITGEKLKDVLDKIVESVEPGMNLYVPSKTLQEIYNSVEQAEESVPSFLELFGEDGQKLLDYAKDKKIPNMGKLFCKKGIYPSTSEMGYVSDDEEYVLYLTFGNIGNDGGEALDIEIQYWFGIPDTEPYYEIYAYYRSV